METYIYFNDVFLLKSINMMEMLEELYMNINKVYSFLLFVLLFGLGYASSLLSYVIIDNNLFVFGVFVLGTLFVFSVFSFGTWLGSLFSLVFFSITLLTGIISFSALVPENQELFGLLLIVGIFGFVASLLLPCSRKKKQLFKPEQKMKKDICVSTYDLKNPEQQSLTMEPFDDFKDVEKDDDFIELQDVDKLVKSEKKASKKRNWKRKR